MSDPNMSDAGKDRQDMYRARLITERKFKKERLIGTTNSDIISNLVINIIKNSINSPSLNMDKEVFDDFEDLIKENYTIYTNEELVTPYNEIIQPLMNDLYARLIEDVEMRNYKSPVFQHYVNNRIFRKSYVSDQTNRIIADPNDIVTDFIASMSDDYFIDICKHLHINDSLVEKISYHEYF